MLGMIIRENVPISELTTMRLGGAARFVLEVEAEDDVAQAYEFAAERNLPTWIMGAVRTRSGTTKASME